MGMSLKYGFEPTVVTWTTLIRGLCDHHPIGLVRDAMKLLLKEVRPKVNQPDTRDAIIYNIVLNGLCKMQFLIEAHALCKQRHIGKAQAMLGIMRKNGVSVDIITCNSILNGFNKRGDIDKAYFNVNRSDHALSLFDELFIKNLVPTNITYNILIDGLFKAGRKEDAHGVISKMMKLKVPFDIYTVNISMKHFAITRGPLLCCFAYSLARGLQPNIHSYNALIYGMFKLGKIKNAEKILEFMLRENALDIFTFNTMIYAYCRIKQVDKALKLVSYMKENGYEPDHVTCETLLEYCILVGGNDRVAEFLDESWLLEQKLADEAGYHIDKYPW
ncbi:pentatricopeptide repeat-containing protein [Senna tora]|uniref:Pentatricopeptide repeat-containing protein n=1 Tax=Senna tora TaxID=362788 RepID=A0A834TNJ4_9FABA|nr:pentatricopeptide repeat-containing protein [Senna tora]